MLGKNLIKAAAGNAGGAGAYIEDVFSTYLYTSNGGSQTFTNGIDLAGEGGLVWEKPRATTSSHYLVDTVRGASKTLSTNNTTAQSTAAGYISTFNSDGYATSSNNWTAGATIASWTFRKAPKFFDVVTWTGNGTNPRQIAHNLGSVPGCIIIKSTTRAENWTVYHTSLGNAGRLALNTTDAAVTGTSIWASTSPTDTHFTVSADNLVNFSGAGYVAYLFAHDAGGFGDDGEQNVISCGSYTGTGASGNTVTLGYEPQWILIKRTNTIGGWMMVDSMRGIATAGLDPYLQANETDAESAGTDLVDLTATGFSLQGAGNYWNASGSTYIYIAIRRGPMKTPTSGTEVFTPITKTGDAPTATLSEIGFQFDTVFNSIVAGIYVGSTYANRISSRLTRLGPSSSQALETSSTAAEASYAYTRWDGQTFSIASGWGATNKNAWYFFRRAPGFFDVVCYNGVTGGQTLNHNLGVIPELMIVKCRTGTTLGGWHVYHKDLGNEKFLLLNDTQAANVTPSSAYWNSTDPTSTQFTLGDSGFVSFDGRTYVAYLFASLAGVSKVGSYTGTGTTLAIDCGFSAGARFVLIKRTNAGANWYVWDSARGIVSGNDPYLLLNSTAAENTSTDYIDPYSAGFEISSTAPAAINASGGSFIFLAIA